MSTATGDDTGRGTLLRILGVSFGVAVIIGGTVGVGILRSPGAVAEHLGSVWLIMLVWILGGVYSLLGANYMAELATLVPRAGGPYVYAYRAIGGYGGFVVGWGDWLLNTLSLSYMCIVFGEYTSEIVSPGYSFGTQAWALAALILITAVNWIGLRAGSGSQQVMSLLKAIALLGFVAACFIFGGSRTMTAAAPVSGIGASGFGALIAFILAFQLVLGTYSGWFSAVYFAEEDEHPERNLPRSLFLGTGLIVIIYVLVNAAIVYVLPMSQLAGSKFAGADAMSVIFGERSGQIVTVLSIVSIVGIINATLMLTPRTLFALGRDGLFFKSATRVNRGGTPTVALALTVVPAIACVILGTFEILVAIAEFLAVTNTILLVSSLFILRRTEPEAGRPFRAWGYPFAPLLMLIAAVLLWIGYIVGNPLNSGIAMAAVVATYPIYRLVTLGAKKAA